MGPQPCFPAQGFLDLIVSVLRFLDGSINIARHWSRAKARLIELLTPYVKRSGTTACGCTSVEHSTELIRIVLAKLVSIFLGNYAKNQSDLEDVPKSTGKPLSRKVLKL